MKSGWIKTDEEIAKIYAGGKIIKDILLRVAKHAQPGVSTYELNELAIKEIEQVGGRPSFLGYGSKRNPFPAALCTSVNDVVVHGVPSTKVYLQKGDILSLDLGMEYQGMYTDTAITVPVGSISTSAAKLIKTTGLALQRALAQVKAGARIGDISEAIETTASEAGFAVVRELVGHGVGYQVHEDPAIPCFGKRGTGPELMAGMVLAIEPMLCEKSAKIYLDRDGWTIRTQDRGLAAHFEDTLAVTKSGYKLLT